MADNYTFKDAGGNTLTHASKDTGSGVHASEHVPVDRRGVEINYVSTSFKAVAVSVGTTAAALPATALTNRRALIVFNNGTITVYLGESGVTAAGGFPLLPGQSLVLETGTTAIYGITASGTVEVRVLEVA